MKLSTASTFDESKYDVIGIVIGMETRSISMFREFFADIKSIFGGKNNLINSRLLKARENAISDLKKNAQEMGADMVIGIDIDTETIQLDSAPVFAFVATGTALKEKGKSETKETVGGKKSRRTIRRKRL